MGGRPVPPTEFDARIRQGTTVWVFQKRFCSGCAAVARLLPALEARFPDLAFYPVDVDDAPDLARRLGIFGVPSLVAFHRGYEIARWVSGTPKSREGLERFLARVVQIAHALDETLAERSPDARA
ncbi:MAG: thioredoxin family protein [Hydrogenibacillus schlegelii]|uniref:Thioredoxin n=1 Tax=Hydrogenibacillus schlegelii TaxID=1484 RepID=A0A2T5GCW6_HYDSH|nr:thioredoxin family protein [Hydrogenibacillus schlegelii]MBT9282388.1 thioredoxin family protein [Hydrogenibacillus schlegelii]PTQ54033.1 MAG: Thioredoxin [Hydrogenibacillus schlegelii]